MKHDRYLAVEGLCIRLLGPVEVASGDALAELPPSKKTRALLAYLVATGGGPLETTLGRRTRPCVKQWSGSKPVAAA